ncbi:tRNA 2-selenouridine(34) synthase MnmH [Sulfitobacter alexandrii]|uniref:tRNA 2-selenouridine(34) synthase MnmH n=1 Tax=Sulfitobacter alexandrii TaxID=1917485 RepID=A0A1J0WD06_9RHOB|nr:tRNA 2-selenouridine(34) synthase MnmH [Sulfitobacter alexandrii]APE42201.1 tRNA 2-selenouridine(34) synthase MnmH [Sulfitobacter alexandrii]
MKHLTLSALADLADLAVDTVIDVRSPAEFAEDHLPGAINLPVLSDAERAEVGTMYKRDSPFSARKLGGALVARNTAAHLDGPLADKEGGWQPLVYCWRGGQRSDAFATILDQVGWRVQLLQGGYRSYRRLVVRTLYDTPLPHRLILIAGGTGTAKTEMLRHLEAAGAQALDLEGLAEHRGSLFGGTGAPQPAQKLFESRLAAALGRLDPARVTWVEAESSKVGDRIVPPALWSAMLEAPRVEIAAPLQARATYLCRAYADLTEEPARLREQIDHLRPYHAGKQIDAWQEQAETGDFVGLAEGLVAAHYDPRYSKAAQGAVTPVRRLSLDDLEEETLRATARALSAEFT